MIRKKVFSFIRQYHMIDPFTHVTAGISGGADSVCMLLLLKELLQEFPFYLTAVYVEHGIRGEESVKDGMFVQELCKRLDVPFIMRSVDVPGQSAVRGKGTEETARILRYEILREVSAGQAHECGAKKAVIATAHHAQDQAETMLFRLSRGTGPAGLIGIHPNRDGIIRPLLCLERTEIHDWLAGQGEAFCTDVTNDDLLYARNRIRHCVIPELAQINEGAVRHMAQTAEILLEAEDYFEQELCEARSKVLRKEPDSEVSSRCAESSGRNALMNKEPDSETSAGEAKTLIIDREIFCSFHPYIRKALALKLLSEVAESRRDFTRVHGKMFEELAAGQTGASCDFPYGITAENEYRWTMIRKKTAIGAEDIPSDLTAAEETAGKDNAPAPECRENAQVSECRENAPVRECRGNAPAPECMEKEAYCREILPPEEILLPDGRILIAKIIPWQGDFKKIPQKTYTKWLDYDKISNSVQLRTRRPGDYFITNAAGGHKKLKDYFIEEKIPRRQRDELMLVASGSHVLWVIGYRISEALKVTAETKRVLELRVE